MASSIAATAPIPTTAGGKRDMSQAEAQRLVDTARARIALADAPD